MDDDPNYRVLQRRKARQGEIIVPARTHRITTRRDVHQDVVS
jgi:hypothetical protein